MHISMLKALKNPAVKKPVRTFPRLFCHGTLSWQNTLFISPWTGVLLNASLKTNKHLNVITYSDTVSIYYGPGTELRKRHTVGDKESSLPLRGEQ